ncbi:hypothetical protein [Wolbachia endosymbiont (group A) of Pogonocherus hispidulus]
MVNLLELCKNLQQKIEKLEAKRMKWYFLNDPTATMLNDKYGIRIHFLK